MKTINFFRAVAAVFAFSLGISSCSKEEIPSAGTGAADEYVEVSLQCTGSISDIEVSPLSRAGSNDLYYIQVLSYHEINGNTYYLQYAHGLFSKKDSIKSVRLRKDEKYYFLATVVEDGLDLIYHEEYDGITGYSAPFYSILNNTFEYANDFSIYYIYQGITDMFGSDGQMVTYEVAPVKRHFGMSGIITPTDGGTVAIDMAPMMFGIRVEAENFTEGKIVVQMYNGPEIVLESPEQSKTEYLSLYDPRGAYYDDYLARNGFYEWRTVQVKWIDTLGQEHFIGQRDITYHRNKIKTIRVRLPQSNSLSDAEISTEE